MSSSTRLAALRKKFRRATAQYMAAGTALMNVGLLTRDVKVEMKGRLKDAGRRCNKRPGEPEEDTEQRVIEATEHLRKWTGQLLDRLPMDTADEMFAMLSADPDRSEALDAEWIDVEESVEDPEALPLVSESTEAPQSVAVALVGDANALTVSLTRDQLKEFALALLLPMTGGLKEKRQGLGDAVDGGLLPPMKVPSVTTVHRFLKWAGDEGKYPEVAGLKDVVKSVGIMHSSDSATRRHVLLSAAYLAALTCRAVADGVIPQGELVGVIPLLIRSRLCVFGSIEEVEASLSDLTDERTKLIAKMVHASQVDFWPDLPLVTPPLADPTVRWDVDDEEDALYPSGKDFGQLADSAALANYGDRLPGHSPAEDKARIKALIVTPVFKGRISAAAQAKLWRGKIQKAFETSGQEILEGYPREYFRRWLNLTEKTVRTWAKAVRDARASAAVAGEPVPRTETVLLHAYPADRKDTQLKLTPAVLELIKEGYNQPVAVDASVVAATIGNISVRSVQRGVARQREKEQVETRAGSRAEEFLYAPTLIRYADKPNRVWLMDSTYISTDLIQVKQKIPGPIDFEMTVAREKMFESGYVERVRVDQLYATLVIDACTGLWLALRVWDKPVGARTAILTLLEAVMRYGRPDVLYSDNGSEFRNKDVASVLQLVGVQHIHSRPYEPKGRGRVERPFRHLKRQVFPHLTGFRGEGGEPVPIGALLTVQEFEAELMDLVETHVNGTALRGMPQHLTRRSHYDTEVGMQMSGGFGDLALHLMHRRDDAVLHEEGVYANGLRYWGNDLVHIMNDDRVVCFSDPGRPMVVHVGIQHVDGSLRYVCPAEQYGRNNPPPAIVEQRRRTAESRRRISALATDCNQRGEQARLIEAATADADAAADELLQGTLTPGPETVTVPRGGALLIGPGDDSPDREAEDQESVATRTKVSRPSRGRAKRSRTKVSFPYDDS